MPSISGSGTSVLLVDDEETDLAVIGKILQGAGYAVSCASNYNQAMALFDAQPQTFDLLLSDISMPGNNGLDLAMALLRKNPGLKILLMSGWVGAHILEVHGITPPERHFLAKPFRSSVLLERVEQVMRTDESQRWLFGGSASQAKDQPDKN